MERDRLLVQGIMVREVVTANKSLSLKQCICLLFSRHVGSAVITDEENRVVDIFAERDSIRAIAQDIPLNTPVIEVMTTNVVTVPIDATFAEARELMRLYRIRHIPVVDKDGRLAGLVSLRHIIDEFFEIIPRTRSL